MNSEFWDPKGEGKNTILLCTHTNCLKLTCAISFKHFVVLHEPGIVIHQSRLTAEVSTSASLYFLQGTWFACRMRIPLCFPVPSPVPTCIETFNRRGTWLAAMCSSISTCISVVSLGWYVQVCTARCPYVPMSLGAVRRVRYPYVPMSLGALCTVRCPYVPMSPGGVRTVRCPYVPMSQGAVRTVRCLYVPGSRSFSQMSVCPYVTGRVRQ